MAQGLPTGSYSKEDRIVEKSTPGPQVTSNRQTISRRGILKGLSAGMASGAIGFHGTAARAEDALDMVGYTLHGRGPKRVIVLHDWTVDCAGDYGMALPFFSEDLMTLALVDVRGYGKSKSITGAYTSAEIAEDVRQVADHLGWNRFSIVGHSMTGMAVQKVMAVMPDRLERVVAATPIPASGFPLDADSFAFFESMAFDDDAFRNGMHALTSGRYGHGWAEFKLAQNRSSVDPEAMKAYTTMWSKEDFSADVAGNTTPILVVYGAHDNEGLRQSATGEAFRSWYPKLTMHVCQSGHYPMMEASVDYANAVQDFLVVE